MTLQLLGEKKKNHFAECRTRKVTGGNFRVTRQKPRRHNDAFIHLIIAKLASGSGSALLGLLMHQKG